MKSLVLVSALALAGCLPREVTFVTGDAGPDAPFNLVTNPRCSRTFPADLMSSPARFQEHIVLGSVFSYRDNLDTMQAAELAVRQANATGGLMGRSFGIVHCDYTPNAGDTMNDVDATTTITRYLVNDLHVPAIIGPRGSPRAIAAFNAARGTQTVIISPSATSTTLTELDNTSPTDQMPGYFWRTVPVDTLQAESAAQDMRPPRRTVNNVAVVYDTGAYGMTFSDVFVRRYMAMGGMTTLFAFPTGMLGDVPDRVAMNNAFDEVIFIATNLSDHTAFLSRIAANPTLVSYYSTRGIFMSAVGFSEMLFASAGAEMNTLLSRIRGTRPAPLTGTQLFNSFATEYMSEFGAAADTSTFAVNSYDAAWLAMYGSAWAFFQEMGNISGLGIARGLRRVSTGMTEIDIRPSNWPMVQNAFRMGNPVNVRGASGSLNYDPMTEETIAPIEVWRIDTAGPTPTFVRDYVNEFAQ